MQRSRKQKRGSILGSTEASASFRAAAMYASRDVLALDVPALGAELASILGGSTSMMSSRSSVASSMNGSDAFTRDRSPFSVSSLVFFSFAALNFEFPVPCPGDLQQNSISP